MPERRTSTRGQKKNIIYNAEDVFSTSSYEESLVLSPNKKFSTTTPKPTVSPLQKGGVICSIR